MLGKIEIWLQWDKNITYFKLRPNYFLLSPAK